LAQQISAESKNLLDDFGRVILKLLNKKTAQIEVFFHLIWFVKKFWGFGDKK
jgi:hypothetical protein